MSRVRLDFTEAQAHALLTFGCQGEAEYEAQGTDSDDFGGVDGRRFRATMKAGGRALDQLRLAVAAIDRSRSGE